MLASGEHVNATLIRDGYATAIRRFPSTRQREFLQLEAQARRRAPRAMESTPMTDLITDPVCSQSALPLAGAPARRFLAPWGYPPTRTPLATIRTAGHVGDLSAQFTLGWIYEHGADVPQDYREAIDWYRRAATQGEPEAINIVGLALLLRKGRPERSA